MEEDAGAFQLKSPAILVIGTVAACAMSSQWERLARDGGRSKRLICRIATCFIKSQAKKSPA
jgi:hypothetical protein